MGTEVKAPDEAVIQAIARAIHQEFVYGADPAHYDDEDEGLARAAYAAMVEHLGLAEETKLIPEWVDLGPCDGACQMVQCHPEHRRRGLAWPNRRRLVSRWRET